MSGRLIRGLLPAIWLTIALASPTFAAWNPSDKDAAITLSSFLGTSNLTASQNGSTGNWRSVRATSGYITGKYYFEVTVIAYDGSNGIIVGLGNASAALNNYAGSDSNAAGFQVNGGVYGGTGGGGVSGWGPVGGTLGIAVDLAVNKMWCTKDGSSWDSNSDNPVTNTGGVTITSVNDGIAVMPMFSGNRVGGNADAVVLNTGGGPGYFRFAIPSGFSGWDGSGSAAGTNTVTSATFDPADKDASVVLSNGDLTATGGAVTWKTALTTDIKYSDKLYFEATVDAIGTNGWMLGIAAQISDAALGNTALSTFLGGDSGGLANTMKTTFGYQLLNGTALGTVAGIAVDITAGKIWFTTNGSTWIGGGGVSGDPGAGTNGGDVSKLTWLGILAGFSPFDSGNQATLNLTGPFTHTLPSGYTGWDAIAITPSVGVGDILLRGVGG